MKNTKTRKKMLLSSVAMLLVALVALGSATYAWYTLNHTVEANTITVKASAPQGLMICETNSETPSDWSNTLPLNVSSTLVPASLNFTTTQNTAANAFVASAVTTEASAQAAYNAATDKAPTSVLNNDDLTNNGYYVVKDFYVKSTGATALSDVYAEIASDNVEGSYMNLVVLDSTDGKILGAVYSDGETNGYITTTSYESSSSFSFTMAKQKDISDAANYTQNTPHHIIIAVYADGQNSNCTTNTANTSDVSFTIKFSSPTLGGTDFAD